MKIVTLEEKLTAQVKNIMAILGSENPLDVKVMMYEMQKEYLNELLESIGEQLKKK
jgi:hypothetical protein